MSPSDPCDDFRRLSAADPAAAALDGQPHTATCEACRDWLQRRTRGQRIVETLTRMAAPAVLDRMVAQEITLSGLPQQAAPSVLDRLVAEELAAGAEAGLVRALAQLERQRAPRSLDRLVAAQVGSGAPNHGARNHRSEVSAGRAPRRLALVSPTLAAASVLLVGGLAIGRWGLTAPDAAPRPEPRVELVMLSSPGSLEPLASGLLDGLRGAPVGSFRQSADGDREAAR